MKNKDNIDYGDLFLPGEEGKEERMLKASRATKKFNNKDFSEIGKNDPDLLSIFGEVGSCFILPPFKCEVGDNIKIGNDFFANFDCSMLDTAEITIGNNVLFGPKVMLITVGHPVDSNLRNEGYMYAYPITIEDNVWIGANVTVNPGVTIGANTVIGAGSVVTKDIPSGVVAVGNPCRVLRKINDEDKTRYFKGKYIKVKN